MSLSWPWQFVSLSESEKQHRRELLTLRGYYAQASVLLAIILLRTYMAFPSIDQPPRDRRRRPWLDSPLFAAWFETRRQYFLCLGWLSWLLFLSVWSTGNDYLHFTKALGHVGLSQLPLQVAMSPAFYVTSTPRASSLVSVLTSIPQPTVTAYHRLFARIVIAPLLVGHAFCYCLFFLQSTHPDFGSLFAKRVRDPDVQWGIAAVSVALSIMLFARPVGATGGIWKGSIMDRRRAFYIVHIMLVGALCFGAFFHVAQAQAFVLESSAIFLVNLGCCYKTVQR
ncbi:ferric reductase-like transmembrane domain-containing protein [Aspergillus lucknowensis]|uniref:Ferric oxidoreductase domain-containing protein n=1 Tax=Aspergillus lucknowensis TaxID=176173 RepID=A0ABR4M3H0_9EURO